MDEDYLEAVLDLVAAVPPGRAVTYGSLAEVVSDDSVAAGRGPRGGPRQVGQVLARAGGGVPWWRVVNASGRPPPHGEREALAALRAEGTPLTPDGTRVALDRALWWPDDDARTGPLAPPAASVPEPVPVPVPGTGCDAVPSPPDPGRVVAVARDDRHAFTKPTVAEIRLVAGWGVDGDVHAGATVRRRVRGQEVDVPNLRQVHVLHAELFDEVADHGYRVAPGHLGENVTTAGVALLELPTGTLLRFGDDAVVRLTGLRNPCRQIDGYAPGLMRRMVSRRPDGQVARRAGVLGVVERSGAVRPGDAVVVSLPDRPHVPLPPL